MRVLLVVLGVIGGTLLLAIAMPFAIWLGADLLPQRTQPVTELTVKLDESGVPGIAARSRFAAVRDGLREPRIGFASMSPSDDSIDVALSEGVDRQQALGRLRDLSHQSGTGHV